jgi:hypothetical protein
MLYFKPSAAGLWELLDAVADRSKVLGFPAFLAVLVIWVVLMVPSTPIEVALGLGRIVA